MPPSTSWSFSVPGLPFSGLSSVAHTCMGYSVLPRWPFHVLYLALFFAGSFYFRGCNYAAPTHAGQGAGQAICEKSARVVSSPQAAAEQNQSTHFIAGHADGVDLSELFLVGKGHKCTEAPPFEQCPRNDVTAVTVVLSLSQMVEEGLCFLSEVWDTRRHFSGELSERRCSDSMEGYGCMGKSGKLEPDKSLATTIPFPADEGQGQGQRYAQTSQATQGRQGQACGGGCATGSDSGRSTSPSCRSSPCSTCCQSFKYRSATYGGTATPGHITGHIMAGKRDVAAEHRAVAWRPRTPRHSSALEGSASGCHATGQGQKRALPGQSGQTKFFLIMGLLYRQNHGFAREAIPGAAAGHRKLCSCRSQMGGAVARGFCYIGSSVRRLTGYTFGLGGDGCLGLKTQNVVEEAAKGSTAAPPPK